MADRARDKFEVYFAEKLWEMLPAFYRDEDGLAERPGQLRPLVEVLAEQAAVLRRSHDRLWEDQFAELCDDWAVPYLGDLVGTRLVSALNRRGRRVDVAKTIYYRRRKGTPRVLEELISDITGWDGKLVESFRRLARARHGLDPEPAPFAGAFTGTPPGGFADLRRPRGAELADTPFDEFHHTPDVRRHRGGLDGRHNIPKLVFHLYRLRSTQLRRVTPGPGPTPQTRTVDPSGRDTPLFMPRNRPDDWDEWRSAREWELPAPMRCRVLGHAEYRIEEALILNLLNTTPLTPAAAAELRAFRGARFAGEARLREAVATLANSAVILNANVLLPLLAGAIVEDCGKFALLPAAFRAEPTPGTDIPRERITSANLADWTAAPPDKRLVVDPERGRLLFNGPAPAAALAVTHFYGFPGDLGAGGYDRGASLDLNVTPPTVAGGGAVTAAAVHADGVTQFDDSATYGPAADKSGIVAATIQAANQQRPYLRLGQSWALSTGANLNSTLTLEGLWVGAAGNFAVVLRGDYERVTINHSTLDPGGEDAQGNAVAPVALVVEGRVEELVVKNSIISAVRAQGAGVVVKFSACDSIIQSAAGAVAVDLPAAEVELCRVTVFGGVNVNRLHASEALITELVDVTDTQNGCFRFSAAPAGSRVPRAYESHLLEGFEHFFTSRRFGRPGYAQLSEAAPAGLLRGAEDGSEIGAFSRLLNPVKLDSLRAKIEEFAPFGLIPLFVFET